MKNFINKVGKSFTLVASGVKHVKSVIKGIKFPSFPRQVSPTNRSKAGNKRQA